MAVKARKRGFTLVELIVVIAIMAILAGVLIPTVTSKVRDANDSSNYDNVRTIASSIARYSLDKTDVTWTASGCTLVGGDAVSWAEMSGASFTAVTGNANAWQYEDIMLVFSTEDTRQLVTLSFTAESNSIVNRGDTISVVVDLLANKIQE